MPYYIIYPTLLLSSTVTSTSHLLNYLYLSYIALNIKEEIIIKFKKKILNIMKKLLY